MNVELKICTKCGEPKPFCEFYVRNEGGERRSVCKSCDKARVAGSYAKLDVETKLRRRLYTLYRLPLERYKQMLTDQGHCCASCSRPFTNDLKPQVDHNHVCSATLCGDMRGYRSCLKHVRRLLCGRCNSVLGHADDDKDLLLSCITYMFRIEADAVMASA